MKKTIYLLILAALITSCQKEMEENSYGVGNNTVLECLPAVLNVESSAQTKTSLVNSGDQAGDVLWSTGDAISAFIGTDGNSKYTLDQASNGSVNGIFNQTAGVTGTAIGSNVVFYPYAETNTVSFSGGKASVNFTLPATQTYKADSFESGYFPMIAVSESEAFGMKNVLGLLELSLKCDFVSSVSKIEFIANVPVCGAATVSACADGEPELVLTDQESKTVALNCETAVALNNETGTKFYIALPAQKYEGFTLRVYDNEGYQMIETTTNTLDLKRSKVASVSLDYIIDLHANGYANCYMLIPSKFCKYRFDATVIGNGSEGLFTGAHTQSVKITPKSAELLYKFGTSSTVGSSDNQQAVNTTSVSLDSKGRVVFNSPSGTNAPGNAVIAVYSEAEGAGDILWSWHIWKPTDAVENQKYSASYTLMDRNLGACVKSNTLNNPNTVSGAYYQWGRKDPFITNAANSASLTTPFTVGRNTSCPSIDVSIRFPSTFYKYESNTEKYGTTHTNKDWLPNDSQNDNLWSSSKTIYDPCPAGYRVADAGAFANINASTSQADVVTTGYTYDLSSFSGDTGVEHYFYGYFTIFGKRNGRGTDGYLWTTGTNGINANAVYYKKDDTHTNPLSLNRAAGAPVRCQKIK